jgi:glyoxylase-like metal-dependent hydrolase (beta-lactamase superfamily II)
MAILVNDSGTRIERLELGPFGTNTYLVSCLETGSVAVIDAPGEADKILERLKGTTPVYIFITHSHPDHVGIVPRLRSELKIPVAAHRADAGKIPGGADVMLEDGDLPKVGNLRFRVLHTPGHTPGSICLLTGKYLLSGDTLFPGGPGKTGSSVDFQDIIESLTTKIFNLPDDTRVYPGHGEPTLLGAEKEQYRVFSSRAHSPELCGDVLWLAS